MSRPDFEGDEAGRCGGCGSRNMMVAGDGQHAICLDCRRLQEPETRDWPEAKMCDNCAFRKGSPERADPYRWAEVSATVETGQCFHCHKGLPVTLHKGSLTATFDPPDPAKGRVTVCAGWLAARIAHCRRTEASDDAMIEALEVEADERSHGRSPRNVETDAPPPPSK